MKYSMKTSISFVKSIAVYDRFIRLSRSVITFQIASCKCYKGFTRYYIHVHEPTKFHITTTIADDAHDGGVLFIKHKCMFLCLFKNIPERRILYAFVKIQ